MTNAQVKEHLTSLLSAYENSDVRNKLNHNYRSVWMSNRDAETIRQAIDILFKKGKKGG